MRLAGFLMTRLIYNTLHFFTVKFSFALQVIYVLYCVLVIVFAVPWHALRRYLLIAEELGMADGEFAFICVTSDVRGPLF